MIHIVTTDDDQQAIFCVLEGPEESIDVLLSLWIHEKIGSQPEHEGEFISKESADLFRFEWQNWQKAKAALPYRDFLITLFEKGFKIVRHVTTHPAGTSESGIYECVSKQEEKQ